MAYSIRTKDGIVINNIPDDVPPDHESLKQRVTQLREAAKVRADNEAFAQSVADPTADMGFLERMRAGAGKAFADVGRGAAQLVGMGPTGDEVAESKRLDQPLMNTAGGITGNIAGNVAMLAPAAMIPGANTVAGAGAIGAITGALQPAESAMDRAKNMATGGAFGAGAQYLGTTGAQKMGEWSARRSAEQAAEKARNTVADETLRRGREAGYVVPPSSVVDSFVGRRLEGVAGKAAIGQEAAIRNQQVTDRLAREAASLGPDEAISLQALRGARHQLAAPHREIAAISPAAARDLEALQMARHESKLAWKEYGRQGVRTAYNDAVAADANVQRLTQALEQHAANAGKPELAASLKEASRKIAQNHQVQAALNRGTGEVDASVIGRALDNGAPLSGPLETIGRFQQSFKPYMREGSTIPTPGVSKLEALAAALLSASGGAAAGPWGMLAGALPLASGPTRAALLSRPVQDAMMPTYAPSMMQRAFAGANDPAVQEKIAAVMRALALPAIPAAVNQ